jgi:hypothetical protein
MSTISLHKQDASDILCRRFAVMTTEFLETPERARVVEAHVPLENLFRVLQMFRYGAFADEPRSGILAHQTESASVLAEDEEWHNRIEAALNSALETSFHGVPKDLAIDELQTTLRWLAESGSEPSIDVRDRSKTFFQSLSTALA